MDQAWADTFWSYRGDDDLIDDEFMRYFEFVTEVAEWRANLEPKGRLEQRAEAAFADGHALRFLVEAFDAWTALDVADYFNQLFTTPDSADWGSDDRATLFFGIGLAVVRAKGHENHASQCRVDLVARKLEHSCSTPCCTTGSSACRRQGSARHAR